MYAHLPSLTLASPAIREAATILAGRRLRGQQGALLPDACRPRSLDDALAIQGAVAGLMNDGIQGWKCGTPGPGKLVIAPIYASTIHRHPQAWPCPVWAHEGQVRVEPELAFLIGKDLPAGARSWQAEEVDAAIGATHLALELIDSRYGPGEEPGFADKLADGLVNQGLLIGPEVDGDAAGQVSVMDIGVRIGACSGTGAGQVPSHDVPETLRPGRHPDPLPRLPLYWLAEFLREQGVGLQAGQFVITGSYAGTFALPVGEPITVRHGALGQFDLRFEAR